MFENMSITELEERKSQIAAEAEKDGADLAALKEEVRNINKELERRAEAAKQRAEIRKAVAANAALPTIAAAPATEKRTAKTVADVRASREYGQAFLDGWRNGDKNMRECRALLTEQATDAEAGLTGYVPVPMQLETEIRTAWEESDLLQLVGRTSFPGDIKISFEVSATGATLHKEGTPAPAEEQIVLGTVKIENDYIKKWIQVSDKALRGTTVDTIGYIYREMAHRIVEEAEKELIAKIVAAPATATTTAVGVPELEIDTIENTTILDLVVMLASGARDRHILMNKMTYKEFRKIEMGSNYFVDVFEGLRDRIHFTDVLPAFSTADDGEDFIIVGDFRNGALLNFPSGDSVEMLVDPYTASESDMVKITGKEFVGMGLVNDKHFAVGKKKNSVGPTPPEPGEAGITLYPKTLSVEVGADMQTIATTTPADAVVTWTSSDDGVAQVGEGIDNHECYVYGAAEGSATVTGTITVDGVDYSDTCEVTVYEPTPSVTLYDLTIAQGESRGIGNIIVPAGAEVTWESDDETVATVANGVAYGEGEGTATVTATITVDGVDYSGSCTVTVTAAASITITDPDTGDEITEVTVQEGESKTIRTTITPTTETVSWMLDDDAAATLEQDGIEQTDGVCDWIITGMMAGSSTGATAEVGATGTTETITITVADI